MCRYRNVIEPDNYSRVYAIVPSASMVILVCTVKTQASFSLGAMKAPLSSLLASAVSSPLFTALPLPPFMSARSSFPLTQSSRCIQSWVAFRLARRYCLSVYNLISTRAMQS